MKNNITKSSSIVINGGKKICGQIQVAGDKISAIHLLFASIILNKKTEIKNMSFCEDIIEIISWIKRNNIAQIKKSNNSIMISPNNVNFDLSSISKSRASICLVSASALKFGKTEISSNIGGCCFTNRSIDRHLDLIKTFGILIKRTENSFVAIKKSKVDKIEFDCSAKFGPSVGVTAHALIGAMEFKGEMILTNIALEPAIKILIEFLQKSTSRKITLKDRIVKINSIKKVSNYSTAVILPCDTTVALTYISMGIATGGNIYLKGVNNLLPSINKLLQKMNVKCSFDKNGMNACSGNIVHPGFIQCTPWPGIPSDIGPVILAGLCSHAGETKLIDKVYNKRSTHVEGLNKMGFCLFASGQNIKVTGQKPIHATVITSAIDIRAGAALTIGALARNSKTIITNAYQIFRGYENFINNLSNLGIDIKTGEIK